MEKGILALDTSTRKKLYLMSNFSNLDLVDRECLSRRLMTLVGKHYEVHQRGQKRLELVVLVLAEAGIEQRFHASDDSRGGQSGVGTGAGKQLAGLRVEALGEVVEQFDTAPNGGGTGGAGLDHHRARGLRFLAGEAEQGLEAGA